MNRKKMVEVVLEALEKTPLEYIYDRFEEAGDEHKEMWENIIKWRLGQREHPFGPFLEQPPL